MSNKNRLKFSVAGIHPLLNLVRNHFISSGMALVPWDGEPDFCLIGAELDEGDHLPVAQIEWQLLQIKDKPVLLLSTDQVYDMVTSLIGRTKVFENTQVFIKPGNDPLSGKVLYSTLSEFMMQNHTKTAVVRPFGVYGPNTNSGVIKDYINTAKKGIPLPIHRSGQHTRTFIHEEDFLAALDLILVKLLKDNEGFIVNVATEEEITMVQLAETIWRLVHGPENNIVLHSKKESYEGPWYKVPDIEKLKSFGWSQKIRLRWGIKELLKE